MMRMVRAPQGKRNVSNYSLGFIARSTIDAILLYVNISVHAKAAVKEGGGVGLICSGN